MDTPKLLYYSIFCFLSSILLGQQVAQGNLDRNHPHSPHSHSSHPSPSKLFVFGDSYVDTGNTKKTEAWRYPYGITFPRKPTGRFSDGRVLTDYVAKFIGVTSPIPFRGRKCKTFHSLKNGMNFAYGGTGVFDTLYHSGPNLTNQIDIFETLIRKSVFNVSDLESSISLVSVVGNDYSTYAARNNGSTDQEWLSFISTVVDQITVNLKRIRGLGVGKIAVLSIQPIGCLPNVTATNSFKQCIERDNSLGFFHDTLLQQAVAKLNNETKHSPFIILDLYSSFMSVLENKESIKFENPLKPCCAGISSEYGCGSVDQSGAKKYVVCEDPKSAFFWDSFHPTHEGWFAVYSALKDTLRKLL